MKQIVLARFGGPEVLSTQDGPLPRPGPGELRIRTEFVGVNFADVNLRLGRVPFPVELPVVPGVEGVGVVDAIGEGVRTSRIGDRVAFLSLRMGAYAEACVVPEPYALTVPPDISSQSAAASILQGITAEALLHDVFSIGPGSVVLVHAAAGGMGLVLTRWTKHLGGTVLGTTSSEAKAEVARAAGADEVASYEDFVAKGLTLTEARGVDYIIDGVGASTLPGDLQVVRERGHIAFYGWSDGVPATVDPTALVARSVTLSGFQVPSFIRQPGSFARRLTRVFAGLREGWLIPRIHQVFALHDASMAQRCLEERKSVGKLLLAI